MQDYKYYKLYDEQRMILRLLVKKGGVMTYKQIADMLDLNDIQTAQNINSIWLDPFIQRTFNEDLKLWFVELKSNILLFCDKISLIKKEKNILHFYFSEQDIIIDYDFITKKLLNINENTVFILPKKIAYGFGEESMLNDIFNIIITTPSHSIPEWIFSYPDLLQNTYEDNPGLFQILLPAYPKTIKKGYIQYCRKNKCSFSILSYRIFLIKSIFGNDKELLYFFDNIEKYIPLRIDFNNIESSLLQQAISILFKIYKYSIKHYEPIDFLILTSMLVDIFEQPELLTLLDTNRGIKTNRQLIRIYQDKKNSEKLAEQLQKLNFINNMIIDDYIIKVPQSLEDLIDEGKQQNNCVGSFYNKSIREGKDLIYFIRRKDKPQKSYVTCRYNIEEEETVEHKFANNRNEVLELMCVRAEIDNIIRNKLKRK